MANLPIKVDKAFHDEWLIEGKIGEGTFGEVFLVRVGTNAIVVAASRRAEPTPRHSVSRRSP